MNYQQTKAFNYIYKAADGYTRTMPLLSTVDTTQPIRILSDYCRFYKDLRENLQPKREEWDLWSELEKQILLFQRETDAFGHTWMTKSIMNSVFTAYETIWGEQDIYLFPTAFNLDIQMFDAWLLSPNCFQTVYQTIDDNKEAAANKCATNPTKYNNIIKSAKTAYIRKITLPEWNVISDGTSTTKKQKWYERTNMIEQLR
jgi:hypothetical protein